MEKRSIHYGWAIVALGFLALAVSMGIRGAFGVYVLPWETDYAQTRGAIGFIGTVSFVVYGTGNLFVGRITEKIGSRIVFAASILILGLGLVLSAVSTAYWQVVLAYGVLASIGFSGASNVTASIAVTRWFTDERRAFLLSLMVAGMGVGHMLLVPLQVLLVSKFSWRPTLLGFGIIYMVLVAPLLWIYMRSSPEEMGLKPLSSDAAGSGKGAKGAQKPDVNLDEALPAMSVADLLRSPYLYALMVPFFFCGFTDMGIVDTHMVAYAQGRGLDEARLATLITVLALASMAGVVIMGYLADKIKRGILLTGMFLLRSLSLVALLGMGNPLLTYLFPVFYGMTSYASIAPMNTHAISLFRNYPIGYVVGITSLSHQLGAAVGAYIPGVVFDSVGAYEPVFTFGAVIVAVVAFLWPWITKSQMKVLEGFLRPAGAARAS